MPEPALAASQWSSSNVLQRRRFFCQKYAIIVDCARPPLHLNELAPRGFNYFNRTAQTDELRQRHEVKMRESMRSPMLRDKEALQSGPLHPGIDAIDPYIMLRPRPLPLPHSKMKPDMSTAPPQTATQPKTRGSKSNPLKRPSSASPNFNHYVTPTREAQHARTVVLQKPLT